MPINRNSLNPLNHPKMPPIHNPAKVVKHAPLLAKNAIKHRQFDQLSPPGLPEASTTKLFHKEAIGPNAFEALPPSKKAKYTPYYPVKYEFPVEHVPSSNGRGYGMPEPLGNPKVEIGPHLIPEHFHDIPGRIDYSQVPIITATPKNGSHVLETGDSSLIKKPIGGVKADANGMPILPNKFLKEYDVKGSYSEENLPSPRVKPFEHYSLKKFPWEEDRPPIGG